MTGLPGGRIGKQLFRSVSHGLVITFSKGRLDGEKNPLYWRHGTYIHETDPG